MHRSTQVRLGRGAGLTLLFHACPCYGRSVNSQPERNREATHERWVGGRDHGRPGCPGESEDSISNHDKSDRGERYSTHLSLSASPGIAAHRSVKATSLLALSSSSVGCLAPRLTDNPGTQVHLDKLVGMYQVAPALRSRLNRCGRPSVLARQVVTSQDEVASTRSSRKMNNINTLMRKRRKSSCRSSSLSTTQIAGL